MAASSGDNAGTKGEDVYVPYESDSDDAQIWMRKYITTIRDCRFYEEEYNECKSYRGKFNSYYTFGDYEDCEHWKNVFENCKLVKKEKDEEALDMVVAHELVRREFRLQMARNNDVWEYRTSPPEDWKTVPPLKSKQKQTIQNDGEFSEETEEEKRSLADRAKHEVAKIQEDFFASKPKVNPKYDDTVQRCTIL